jgi:hypothetical protein
MLRTDLSCIAGKALVSLVILASMLPVTSSAQTKLNSTSESLPSAASSSSSNPDSALLTESPAMQSATPTGLQGGPPRVAGLTNYVFPGPKERRKAFLTDFIGPGAFIAPAFQATADQTFPLKVSYPRDGYPGPGAHPEHGAIPEWSEGFDGYTKRYASRFGMGLIGTASRYGIGELLHQDVSYHPCQCTGTLPRAFHAITQAFVARTASGRSIPSIAALISPFVGAEVATVAWYPARYNASDALRTSTALYLSLPLKNLVKERESH